jgi:competence protein ComGC
MKLILIISILLNVILIYNLGKYKQTIDRKDKFINKWIEKERQFNHREDYDSFNKGYN